MVNEFKEIGKLFEKLMNKDYENFPDKRGKLDVPINQGVYIISDKRGKIFHVGRTLRAKEGLHQRFQNHLAGNSSFVINHPGMNKEILRTNYKYKFLEVENSRKRALLEAYAIANLCPVHLGLGENN